MLVVRDGARVCTHLWPCVFIGLCVYPRAYNETWQRRLECSLGTRESPTRPAPLPPPPLLLLKAFLQEETEAEGKHAATRKELVGIPLTRLLSSRLRHCTSSPPLPSFFLHRLLCLSLLFPSFHRITPNIYTRAHVLTFKLRWRSHSATVTSFTWYISAYIFVSTSIVYTVFEQEIL